jgi:hypothetical protein
MSANDPPPAPEPGAHDPVPNGASPGASAAFFAQVSRELMEEHDEAPTLQRIAERAVEVVPAADHCGISLRRRRHKVESVAATSDLALRCDTLQYELEEGPCLDAVLDSESYLTDDTRTETRWPRWAPRVAEEGVGSVLSIRLATNSETLGALNLYAGTAGAFTTDDVDLALIYALHATNAMSSALLVTGLQTAVNTRHTIGVAQGILMQRYDLTMQQAFEVLRRYSSHSNTKLRDVADKVVHSKVLPDLDALPEPHPSPCDSTPGSP